MYLSYHVVAPTDPHCDGRVGVCVCVCVCVCVGGCVCGCGVDVGVGECVGVWDLPGDGLGTLYSRAMMEHVI